MRNLGGRPKMPEYRKRPMRFAKFENFIDRVLTEIEDEEAKRKIEAMFEEERKKAMAAIS